MRVIGVIPARWGSTRLPGKSLVPICGKPLIQWVVEGVRRAVELDDFIVATDDDRIVDAVVAIGAKAVMTKPDHPSGSDRVAEAVLGMDSDIVINIQGDEPLIDPDLIDRMAVVMKENDKWDMATAAVAIGDMVEINNTSVVKVVTDQDGRALYFSRSVIPCVRDKDISDLKSLYKRHLGLYAYRKKFLDKFVATAPCLLEKAEKLEQLRALWIGARMVVLEAAECGVGVDTQADVLHVENLIRKLHGIDMESNE